MRNNSVVTVVIVICMLAGLVVLYYKTNQREHIAFSQEQERLIAESEQTLRQEIMSNEEKENTDSIDWINALVENTPEAYRQYLEVHINGSHAEDAREMLEVFSRTRCVVHKDSSLVCSDSLQQQITEESVEKENVELHTELDTIQ